MKKIQFDYYHGMEADQYTFYRIPKALFTAEYFRSLSCEAKVLYGLLLDRMSLSRKNHWVDEENRVYIIFTIEEVMDFMCCKSQKAMKLMKELDCEHGIGLIEKKRLGLGKPNIIYVKNFMIKGGAPLDEAEGPSENSPESQGETVQMGSVQNQKSGILKIKNQEFPESKNQNFENQKSEIFADKKPQFSEADTPEFEDEKPGILKIESPEFPESKNQNFENQKSEILKIKNPEFRFSKSNNTDINHTDLSKTEYSKTENNKTENHRSMSGLSISIHQNPIASHPSIPDAIPNMMDKMEAHRDTIRKQISYECFSDEHDREIIDELIDLIVEAMMMPDNHTLRIAGVEKPVVVVKNQFMKLDQTHIEYILTCLHTNTKKVNNIRAYLLTTLYNAPMTVSNYYQAEVNHDLCGGRIPVSMIF